MNRKAGPGWTWVEAARTYRDNRTGRFMDATTTLALRAEVTARNREKLHQISQDLIAGNLTPSQWEEAMTNRIQTNITQQYAFARGGIRALNDDDLDVIGAHVAGQQGYLAGFRADVELGDLSEAQILARTDLYANYGQAAYESGWAVNYGIEGDLPQVPGDGQTQCGSNCLCTLQMEEHSDGIDVYWILDDPVSGSCDDCIRLSEQWNPLTVARSG